MTSPLWQPSAERVARANLTAFAARVGAKHRVTLPDYTALYRWSVEHTEAFWREVWDYGGVIGDAGARTLADGDRMPGARWFPDARLNFAENLLARRPADDAADALVFRGEDKVKRRISHCELRSEVSRVAQALRALGVKPGDRVAAFVPNMPEAIVAMLAAASIGAIWSSASPDFGVQGVLDRFGQIEPSRAVHRRRVLVQRQAAADRRQGGGDRAAPAHALAASWSPRISTRGLKPGARCPAFRAPRRGTSSLRPSRRRPSPSSACRSITRSTSSIRPGRPECRSASCTAREARCSST